MHDRRTQVIFDAARHYVRTARERFDIITSDPIHPWVKGSATLYTKEYFQLCKRRLNPGGVITQWVPLYESNVDVVKREIATFFHVFPHGTIWSNDKNGDGYDIVLLAQDGATRLDIDEIHERLDRPDHAAVVQSLKEVGFKTAIGLFRTYAGRAADLTPWLEHAEINRDRNLRLQYPAGMWPNVDHSKQIFNEMVIYRKFPEEVFAGTGLRTRVLRGALNPHP